MLKVRGKTIWTYPGTMEKKPQHDVNNLLFFFFWSWCLHKHRLILLVLQEKTCIWANFFGKRCLSGSSPLSKTVSFLTWRNLQVGVKVFQGTSRAGSMLKWRPRHHCSWQTIKLLGGGVARWLYELPFVGTHKCQWLYVVRNSRGGWFLSVLPL